MMNSTYLSEKLTSSLKFLFKQITNKFTAPYKKLKQWFPILENHAWLKYAMIPLIIAFIAGLRTVMKQVIGALANLISTFTNDISDINIPESSIIIAIIGIFISIKIISQITKGRKTKSVQS